VITFHLAQFNVARLVAPLDSPELAGFVAQLGAINALAEAAPGFLWRFQTDAGDATALRPYQDERIIVNLSVWTTPEALHEFVYRTAHAAVMARRREWFERLTDAFLVLWWVPAGHHPTIQEAIAHLETLRRLGDSPEAFSFKRLFPAPSLGAGVAHDTVEDAASG
jgi:uncharacterized protein DUF3291